MIDYLLYLTAMSGRDSIGLYIASKENLITDAFLVRYLEDKILIMGHNGQYITLPLSTIKNNIYKALNDHNGVHSNLMYTTRKLLQSRLEF